MSKKFERKIEDFTCGHCGAFVKGNGFTNHCPECLWSKHVDENPGDRLSRCHGMMRPVAIEGSPADEIVLKCERCGLVKRNKVATADSFERIIEVAKNRAKRQ